MKKIRLANTVKVNINVGKWLNFIELNHSYTVFLLSSEINFKSDVWHIMIVNKTKKGNISKKCLSKPNR